MMTRFHTFVLLALVALLAGLPPRRAAAQGNPFGFEYRPLAKIVQGTDTLALPWVGGLNAAQFSNIDLNADGRPDLFCFERSTDRVLTFLDAPAPGGGRRWAYAPDYETLFPSDLHEWALLRDYDCDGRPDLFTGTRPGAFVKVYRNTAGPGGRPRFAVAAARLLETYLSGANPPAPQSTAITTGAANVPTLADVNGDGRLDLATWDFNSSSYLELYLNTSPGPCGGALRFERAGFGAWGGIAACGGCAGFANGRGRCREARRGGLHTGGHALALVDLDGDGDLDALDGRDNCAPLVRLTNVGTAQAARFDTLAMSASWPAAARPAQAPVFACASPIDGNFDGRPDVAVAPVAPDNIMDKVTMRGTVRLVPNTGTLAAPAYGLPVPFLQDQMLDVSEAAAPAFGDLDGDGLTDMLVGNLADDANGRYRAALAYYRNVGSRTRPVFRLITEDYLGLAGFRSGSNEFTGLKPQLVDLNRDGALDLAFGVRDQGTGRIYFILNAARPGQPAAFDPATATYLKGRGAAGTGIVPYYNYDAPHFTDVDGDGFVDLLVGTDEIREPGGVLRYFRNLGLARLDTSFALANADFGRFGAATQANPRLLAPVVADFDGDGRPDLLTAESAGGLQFVSDYRAQPALFSALTQAIFNPTTGVAEALHLGGKLGVGSDRLRFAPAAADLDGDGAPELYLGTQGGGIVAYGTRNRLLGTARAAALALGLNVFPNPATATVSVEGATPTRLLLLDLAGRTLRPAAAPALRHALDVRDLAPGLYLLRATAADGRSAVRRLEVGR